MLAGKAVLHPEHMSVTMGMNAWRKWFDESACVKRLAGFLNRNNRSKKTMKDVPKELEKQKQKHNNNKINQNSSLEKIYFKNERPWNKSENKIEAIQYDSLSALKLCSDSTIATTRRLHVWKLKLSSKQLKPKNKS